MAKQRIRLTESQLNRVIKESVNRIIKEDNNDWLIQQEIEYRLDLAKQLKSNYDKFYDTLQRLKSCHVSEPEKSEIFNIDTAERKSGLFSLITDLYRKLANPNYNQDEDDWEVESEGRAEEDRMIYGDDY